ncbi:hypothetical protein CEXT_451191 [Caerostris extrusa]|uniref:Uncharacterized protein n=1 Tax=Caerostris extrusa TaxID=172846 RepID=A0AAV4Y2K0_CAEEX|nr:hypothetical protein CEXT_451191 [Caerostris extrusa]
MGKSLADELKNPTSKDSPSQRRKATAIKYESSPNRAQFPRNAMKNVDAGAREISLGKKMHRGKHVPLLWATVVSATVIGNMFHYVPNMYMYQIERSSLGTRLFTPTSRKNR